MATKYTQQQIDKVLEKLPDELREAIFSMETADVIWQTCLKQKIADKRMSKIAEYAGYVLMGLLLPQEFQVKLQKEIKLSEKAAKEVGREINRFIFYPVKPALEELYKIEIAPSTKPSKVTPPPSEEKPEAAPRKDTYREPIE